MAPPRPVAILVTGDPRQRWRRLADALDAEAFAVRPLDWQGARPPLGSLRRALSDPALRTVVIFGQGWKTVATALLARLAGKTVVQRLGGDPVANTESRLRAAIRSRRPAAAAAALFDTLSARAARRLAHRAIAVSGEIARCLPPGRAVDVVPQFIALPEPAAPRPRAGPLRILTVTNLRYREKALGAAWLASELRAWCDGAGRPAAFDIAGGGAEEETLRRTLPDGAGGPLTVSMLGRVADVPARLRAADVFVYRSTLDAVPNAILEAMAHALPIVVNDHPSFHDIVEDGRSALFYSDAGSFRAAMSRLADDPALAAELGRAARARAEAAFSREAVGRRLAAILA